MNHEDRIGATLRRHAEDVTHGHPLGLDDVKHRARGLRRRRTAVSGLAAAAVLAVAVPVGLSLDGGPSAPQRPDSGPAAAPTVPDSGPKDGVLTTEVDASSAEPGVPYFYDGAIRLPDGDTVPVSADYRDLAALGDGWVAVRWGDDGDSYVDLLDGAAEVTFTEPSTGPLAVSHDGSVVAYGTPDGALMTVVAGDEPRRLNDTDLPAPAPTAVIGSGSCEAESPGGGCVVYYDSYSDGGGAYLTSKGIGGALPGGLRTVAGLSSAGELSGITELLIDGSCSAVLGAAAEREWRTCDHTVGRFSPDGEYVLGHPAYRDGIGDGSLAILDAETGEVVAEWQTAGGTEAFLNDAVWDTDGTVLATVHQQGTWSLMRMNPDGGLSTVLGDLGGTAEEVPLHLPSRP